MDALAFLAISAAYLTFSARDRVYSLAGAGLLLPFNQYLPNLGLPFGNVHTLVMLGLAVGILRTPRAPGNGPRPPVALVLFAVVLFIGYLQSAALDGATRTLFALFKEKTSILFVCYAAFKIADSEQAVRKSIWGCVLGAGAETLFCFLEFGLRSGDVTGHLETRGATGAFLATYTSAYLGIYLGLRSDPRRKWFLIAVVVGSVATIGTNSRGSIVAIGATFVVVLLVKNRALFVALLLIVLSNQFWMPERLRNRFATVEEDAESGGTVAQRTRIWRAGLDTFARHPLGVGLGRFAPVVASYSDDPVVWSRGEGGRSAHNEVILVLVELGIHGLVIFFWLLASVTGRSLRTYWHDQDILMRSLGLGALCGLMGGFVASMGMTLLLRTDISGILWIVLGICARRGARPRRSARRVTTVTKA